MRKAIKEGQISGTLLSLEALIDIGKKGYKFVQVKSLTVDKHYDYIEPSIIMLVPCKELPTDPAKKDIFEPIDSELLRDWARETNDHTQIFIAKVFA